MNPNTLVRGWGTPIFFSDKDEMYNKMMKKFDDTCFLQVGQMLVLLLVLNRGYKNVTDMTMVWSSFMKDVAPVNVPNCPQWQRNTALILITLIQRTSAI